MSQSSVHIPVQVFHMTSEEKSFVNYSLQKYARSEEEVLHSIWKRCERSHARNTCKRFVYTAWTTGETLEVMPADWRPGWDILDLVQDHKILGYVPEGTYNSLEDLLAAYVRVSGDNSEDGS